MTRPSDTAQMQSEARLTEVAGILAAGYVRHRLAKSSQKELDLTAGSMALMGEAVNHRVQSRQEGTCSG